MRYFYSCLGGIIRTDEGKSILIKCTEYLLLVNKCDHIASGDSINREENFLSIIRMTHEIALNPSKPNKRF